MNFIFDLYGTLADIHTDEHSAKFRKSMKKYFGCEDFWQRYVALCKEQETGDKYCEIDLLKVFKQFSPDNPEQAAKYFRKKSRSRLKVYAGVHSLLKKLKEKGAKLYILSNAQACFTLEELKKLKLTKYFDGIELSSGFGKKKPSTEFFGHIATKYSLDKSQTVYIGNDFGADILGAKAAGLNSAYIKSNLSPVQDSLGQADAVCLFATDSFKQLKKYLLSL